MTLIGVYGNVGSGKTLISTIDDFFTPREIPIYCNFKLNLPNAELIEPEEVFEVFTVDEKIPIKKLVTDEAYGWYESRGSGVRTENEFFSYLMFQSRKVGLVWKSIAQLRGTLDLRWRGMENKVIVCHERALDMAGRSTQDFNFTIIKNTVSGVLVSKMNLPYKKSLPFFKLYNTNETILPQGFDEMKIKMKNKDITNLNAYINELVNDIYNNHLELIPVKIMKDGTNKYKITQEFVRDLLLQLNKPPEYASSVKVRLENKLNM